VLLTLWLGCQHKDSTSEPGSSCATGGTTDTVTSDTDTVPTGALTLTVNGGYGGGAYAAGAPVHVWADVDPQAEIVTGWEGDTDVLDAPIEWNSPGTMPDHSATLTPTVEALPYTVEHRVYSLNGHDRDALVVKVDGAKGAVLFFHGASYSVDELCDNAGATITRQLVHAGYTVVAVQSEAEAAAGTGGWASDPLDPDQNEDLGNVRALIDALHADGTVPTNVRIAAWGMSSGGFFAHAVGAVGLADAVVGYCAAGGRDANDATTAATAYYMAINDQTFPTGAADAAEFSKNLTARGVASDVYVHPLTPLYDQRFERVAGIDAAKSKEIADQLRASGAVDANDLWTKAGSAITGTLSVSGLTPEQLTAVKAEIEIMAADHELYDDVAARMVAFLDVHL
jgi:hypothetical protein